jgi:cytosine/adenosine deaminase-related metal-dependent hydrolase
MFSAIRALMMGTRAAANAEALARHELLDPLPLSCRQVLEFATRAGAHANGLDDTVGSITVGKAADLVMIDTNALNLFPINNAANAVVEAAHPGNVDSVFVAGRAVKRGGTLLGVDLGELRARVESARDKLLARSGVGDSERWAPAPYRGH